MCNRKTREGGGCRCFGHAIPQTWDVHVMSVPGMMAFFHGLECVVPYVSSPENEEKTGIVPKGLRMGRFKSHWMNYYSISFTDLLYSMKNINDFIVIHTINRILCIQVNICHVSNHCKIVYWLKVYPLDVTYFARHWSEFALRRGGTDRAFVC